MEPAIENGSSSSVGDEIKSSSIPQKQSFDPNNNINQCDLGEAINGRLVLEKSQSKCAVGSDLNNQYDENDISDGFSEEEGVEVDAEESNVDEEEDVEEANDEPYDVDKALISTFLEQTTSIVRSSQLCVMVSFFQNPRHPEIMKYSLPLLLSGRSTFGGAATGSSGSS